MTNSEKLLDSLGRKANDPVSFGQVVDLVLAAAEATREKTAGDVDELLGLISELQGDVAQLKEMVAELSTRVTQLEQQQ